MPTASGRMAIFIFPDGRTLEIHVPGAARVRGGPSAARMAGFILRRGREGHAYAERLQAAGVPTQLECHRGLMHGFVGLGDGIEAAAAALKTAAQALGRALRPAHKP